MRFPFIQRHHGCQVALSWGSAGSHQPEKNVSGVTDSLGTVWIPPPALRWKSEPFSFFNRTPRHRNAFSRPRGLAQGAGRVSIFVGLSGFLSLLPDAQQELTDAEGKKMGGEFLNTPEGASLFLQKQNERRKVPGMDSMVHRHVR